MSEHESPSLCNGKIESDLFTPGYVSDVSSGWQKNSSDEVRLNGGLEQRYRSSAEGSSSSDLLKGRKLNGKLWCLFVILFIFVLTNISLVVVIILNGRNTNTEKEFGNSGLEKKFVKLNETMRIIHKFIFVGFGYGHNADGKLDPGCIEEINSKFECILYCYKCKKKDGRINGMHYMVYDKSCTCERNTVLKKSIHDDESFVHYILRED